MWCLSNSDFLSPSFRRASFANTSEDWLLSHVIMIIFHIKLPVWFSQKKNGLIIFDQASLYLEMPRIIVWKEFQNCLHVVILFWLKKLYMHTCVCVSLCVYIMHVYMYILTYMCVYVCMYIYIHTYIYRLPRWNQW